MNWRVYGVVAPVNHRHRISFSVIGIRGRLDSLASQCEMTMTQFTVCRTARGFLNYRYYEVQSSSSSSYKASTNVLRLVVRLRQNGNPECILARGPLPTIRLSQGGGINLAVYSVFRGMCFDRELDPFVGSAALRAPTLRRILCRIVSSMLIDGSTTAPLRLLGKSMSLSVSTLLCFGL